MTKDLLQLLGEQEWLLLTELARVDADLDEEARQVRAELDRLDEILVSFALDWDSEQPRDEHGRFGEGTGLEASITKGSLGIPREQMPQFPGQTAAAFVNGLEADGFKVTRGETRVGDLKPTQSTMNMEKVLSMATGMPTEALSKPVITSSDGHILDGHHRWAALKLRNADALIQTHQVDMPIRDLVARGLADPTSIRRTVKDEWDESQHPRAENGQFGEGGGGGGRNPEGSRTPRLACRGREVEGEFE